MIPESITYFGDIAKGREFKRFAKSQMNILKRQMSIPPIKHQGERTVSPYPGVTIYCSKRFSVERIEVHVVRGGGVSEILKRKKRKRYENTDNRFFVRVGKPTDIVVDELGHIVTDSTRYYWIDFALNPEAEAIADQIGFYQPGGELEYEYANEIVIVKSRNVTNNTFLQVVTFPDYMFHNYIRSFDLADVSGKDRFVAGYHFLATGDDIFYTPTIALVAGGEVDLETSTSKNPANRFFVDLESRTMCWYHTLQEWYVPEGGVVVHTQATGSMAGTVVGVDIVNEAWVTVNEQGFSVTGDIADSFAVETTGSDTMHEPIGVLSDVSALSRSGMELYVTMESTPLKVTYSIGSGVAAASCIAVGSMFSLMPISNGYEPYQVATYSYEYGETPDILQEDTEVIVTNSVFDCSSNPACPGPNGTPMEVLEEGSYYTDERTEWMELTLGISAWGVPEVGYTDVYRGRNNAQKSEYVYCQLHFCTQEIGYCQDSGAFSSATKSLSGYVSGRFGTRQDFEIPCQNMVLLSSTTKETIDTTLSRNISGPTGGADDLSVLSTALSVWNKTNPLYLPPPAVQSNMNTPYPVAYTVEDPANWLPLGYFPLPVPDLVFNGPSTSWGRVTTHNTSETTTDDLCVIKDCPDTFTASELISAVILDDRWSEGSQGIAISVKSNAAGESAIYHNEVNKTQAIITALMRDGLLRDGEYLFNIGLI